MEEKVSNYIEETWAAWLLMEQEGAERTGEFPYLHSQSFQLILDDSA